MAVTFDAVGPSSTGYVNTATPTASPQTWTHTVASNATALIVWLAFDGASGTPTATVTAGGVSMSAYSGNPIQNGSTNNSCRAFTLLNPPTGTVTISATVSDASADAVTGGSLSFIGASAFGTPVTVATNTGAITLTVTGVAATSMVAGFIGTGSTPTSPTTGTNRFQANGLSGGGQTNGQSEGATNTGTGSVSVAWNNGAGDSNCGYAVEVQAGTAIVPPPAPLLLPMPPGWFPGSDAAATEPDGIPFYQQPIATDATPAPLLPVQAPPALPYLAPLLPPGWFPGSDAAATEPDGVPFYQAPLPVIDPGAVEVLPPQPPYPPYAPIAPYWQPGDLNHAAPDQIPFYVQPMPDSSPALPPTPTVPVITGLAGVPGPGYFIDQYSNPRLWVAMETWGLPYSAGEWNGGNWQADYQNYLTTRGNQGATVLMCDPVVNGNIPSVTGNTWDGVSPFNTSGDPTSGLNPAFWQRVDYCISTCAANGITFAYVINGHGWNSGYLYATWTTAQFTAYGTAIANRYKNTPNFVWLFGNDATPGSEDAAWNTILAAIRATGDTHVLGAWWCSEETSRYTIDPVTASTWGITNSQFNFVYTYNAGYYDIQFAYGEVINQGQANLLPVIWGDGQFYFNDGATYYDLYDRSMRQETLWCLTSGARGVCNESNDVYPWDSAACLTIAETAWFFSNQKVLFSWFEGLTGWHQLLPDLASTFITAGRGTSVPNQVSGGSYTGYEPSFVNSWVSASINPSGSLAVCYLPNATTITVNTAMLGPGWVASWVDPVTFTATSAGAGPTFNSTAKGSNSQGDPDWLLVFQGNPIPALTATLGTSPMAPGWFPGADRVTAVPGGIPFALPAMGDASATSAGVTQQGAATLTGTGTLTSAATQGAIATLTGTGTLANAATQGAGATLSGGAALTNAATQGAGAILGGTGSVSSADVQGSGATLTGAGALTNAAVEAPVATLSGAGVLTAAVTQAAGATLTGAGSLISPDVVQGAGATLTGTGSLTAAAIVPGAGAATLNGTGTLTAAAVQGVTATLAGTGSLTSGATQGAGATLAGTGTLTAPDVTQGAGATLAGTGSLTAPDVVQIEGTTTLGGTGSLTAAGTVPGGGAATLAGTGTLTGAATQGAGATLTGTGSLTAAAVQGTKTTLAGTGSLTAAGLAVVFGAATLTGTGSLTSAAGELAGTTLAGTGTLTALARQQAAATLTGLGVLTGAGVNVAAFTVGTLTASAQPYATLTAATASGAASGGTLTASTQRTGGPS